MMRRWLGSSLMVSLFGLGFIGLGASQLEAQEDRSGLLRLTAMLSDDRPTVHKPGIIGLRRFGVAAIPELSVLARDSRAGLRLRVTLVLAGIIDSRSVELLTLLAQDGDSLVRESALLALGGQQHDDQRVFDALSKALHDYEPLVRESAILSLGRFGNPAAIAGLTNVAEFGGFQQVIRWPFGAEGDRLRRQLEQSMRSSLRSLVAQPQAYQTVSELLTTLSGPRLEALLIALQTLGDTRLSAKIAQLLHDDYHIDLRVAAAAALLSNGDSRALPALVAQASLSGHGHQWRMAEAAATTLRSLTGHQAAAGEAWKLWWREHESRARALFARDEFIADAHDPAVTITAAQLAAFTAEELWPLAQAVLGEGAPFWQERAFKLIMQDDQQRWVAEIVRQLVNSQRVSQQVPMLVLLHRLGGADALAMGEAVVLAAAGGDPEELDPAIRAGLAAMK